jgi:hypothetical protein
LLDKIYKYIKQKIVEILLGFKMTRKEEVSNFFSKYKTCKCSIHRCGRQWKAGLKASFSSEPGQSWGASTSSQSMQAGCCSHGKLYPESTLLLEELKALSSCSKLKNRKVVPPPQLPWAQCPTLGIYQNLSQLRS